VSASLSANQHSSARPSAATTTIPDSTLGLECSCRETSDEAVVVNFASQGKRLNRDTFPDAILNGAKLDLFALYKEVVSRGGFK